MRLLAHTSQCQSGCFNQLGHTGSGRKRFFSKRSEGSASATRMMESATLAAQEYPATRRPRPARAQPKSPIVHRVTAKITHPANGNSGMRKKPEAV